MNRVRLSSFQLRQLNLPPSIIAVGAVTTNGTLTTLDIIHAIGDADGKAR